MRLFRGRPAALGRARCGQAGAQRPDDQSGHSYPRIDSDSYQDWFPAGAEDGSIPLEHRECGVFLGMWSVFFPTVPPFSLPNQEEKLTRHLSATAVVLCKWVNSIETLTAQDGITELEFCLICQVKTALGDM